MVLLRAPQAGISRRTQILHALCRPVAEVENHIAVAWLRSRRHLQQPRLPGTVEAQVCQGGAARRGVAGAGRGGGWAEECGVVSQVDVVVGTLSKGFGAQGGFVACSWAVRALLLNMGRPYVFSTALAAPVVAAAHAALHVSREVNNPPPPPLTYLCHASALRQRSPA